MSDQSGHGGGRRPGDPESREGRFMGNQAAGEAAARTFTSADAMERTWLGHPRGLFILFFVEMWERFGYYGMRGLLMLYMVAQIAGTGAGGGGGGLGMDRRDAGTIYGWFTALVYFTCLFGGMIADKLIGTHRSMVLGACIMSVGYLLLAAQEFIAGDTGMVSNLQRLGFFGSLMLIIIGTGFFKPCVSVMVGQLYKEGDPRRDSGFTIFYMGINLGAFLAGILCAILAVNFGWWAGFGAAGLGMWLGLGMYLTLRPEFLRGIGLPPAEPEPTMRVMAKVGLCLLVVALLIAGYMAPRLDAMLEARGYASLPFAFPANYGAYYLVALGVGVVGAVIWFISIQTKEERGPTAALFIICLFVIFFWYAFEQAGSSMNVFAQQRSDRAYPWALVDQDGVIDSGNLGSNWAGMDTTFDALHADVTFASGAHGGADGAPSADDPIVANPFNLGAGVIRFEPEGAEAVEVAVEPATSVAQFGAALAQQTGGALTLSPNEASNGVVLRRTPEGPLLVTDLRGAAARNLSILSAREFPAAWYQSVNALFILIFAPVFGVLWAVLRKRRLEPSTPLKMASGLLMLGGGFVFMVLGAKLSDSGVFIPPNATEGPLNADGSAVSLVRVSVVWLTMAYLLHTWGELCLSPIGLSLTTKLAPRKWVAFMMGVWFLAPSIAQLIGGYTFAYIEPIERGDAAGFPVLGGQADFFLIFVITSLGAGVVLLLLTPIMKRLIGGRG